MWQNTNQNVIKLLIDDKRVNLNLKNKEGKTHLLDKYTVELLKQYIASTRYFEVNSQTNEGDTLKKLATQEGGQQVVKLIEGYEKDAEETTKRIRKEMRLSEKLTKGERFIYYCADGQIGDLKLLLQGRKLC